MKKKKRSLCIVGVVVLTFVSVWMIMIIKFNIEQYRLDDIPEENYKIGEYASYDENYAYGSYPKGYSIKATGYEILDTDEYLRRFGKTTDDFEYFSEKVCVVDVTVRMDKKIKEEENEGLFVGDIMMCGLDYYADQNEEFFMLENPQTEGMGIVLHDKMEYETTLVFNLRRDMFTKYNWNHLEKEKITLFLTAFPVQKNIVLQ